MQANPAELSEALVTIFKSLTVTISRNHNPQTSDTWVLSIAELKKNFIFDSNTGKFLGSIDMPEPVPVNEYAPDPNVAAFGPFSGMPPLQQVFRTMRPLLLGSGHVDDTADILLKRFGPR